MEKQKILFKKIPLKNNALTEYYKNKLFISKSKEIYFYNKNKNKIICYNFNNDIINMNGISYYAEIDGKFIKLFLIINSSIINNLFNNPIKIKNRKKFILMLQKCIIEAQNEYLNTIQLGILCSAYNYNNNNNELNNKLLFNFRQDNLNWLKTMEHNSNKINYVLPQHVIKIGSYFINTNTGEIKNSVNRIPTRFRGGILVNKVDKLWKYDFLNLPKISFGGKIKDDYFNTKATLIICSNSEIKDWENKINTINKAYYDSNNTNFIKKFKIINNHKSHENTFYKDIFNTEFLIITNEYLESNDYYNIISEYNINNNFNDSINSMKEDYLKSIKKVKNINYPILSLFYWNRIIIDNFTINKIYNNNTFYNNISTIESYFKWIQLDNAPSSINELTICIDFLIKYKNVNLPLYDDMYNLVYLGNIIKFNTDIPNINKTSIINTNKIIINMNNYEKNIFNYFIECSQDKFNENFKNLLMDTVNTMSLKKKIVNNNFDFNDKECSICYEQLNFNNAIITNCNHYYCITCSLKSIRFSNSCAYCRNNIDFNNYLKITPDNQNIIYNEKYNFINNIINNNNSKNLIVYNSQKLNNCFNFNNILFLNNNKRNLINNFNNNNYGTILINYKDRSYIKYLKNINNTFIYDYINKNIYDDIYNTNIYSNITNSNIYFLAYKNTIEEKILKNI